MKGSPPLARTRKTRNSTEKDAPPVTPAEGTVEDAEVVGEIPAEAPADENVPESKISETAEGEAGQEDNADAPADGPEDEAAEEVSAEVESPPEEEPLDGDGTRELPAEDAESVVSDDAAAPEAAEPEDVVAEETVEEAVPDPDRAEDDLASEDAPDETDNGLAAEEPAGEEEKEPDTAVEEPEPVAETPAPEPEPARARTGPSLIALVAGGAVAAGLGFFAARTDLLAPPEPEGPTPVENAALITEQQSRLAALGEELDMVSARDIEAPAKAAVAPVEAALTDGLSQLNARLDQLTDRIDVLSERVETIALRPTATGINADEFDDALQEFRDQLNAAIATADEAIVSAQDQISEAQAEAQRISSEAFSKEQAATARAAWSQIQTALESGAPYADSVSVVEELTGETLPGALKSGAANGVPTLAELQQAFPDAARDALNASIRADTGQDAGDRLWSFIRVQSGARSLTPREGNDPDAVLSRIEEALRTGNLTQALAEAETLPETGRNALSSWEEQARTRVAALDAAQELSSRMNSN